MKQQFIDVFVKTHTAHREIINACVNLEHDILALNDVNELADACYALREVYNYLDEARKEVRRINDLAAKIFTAFWAADPNVTEPSVKTEWCTVTPNIKTRASIPSPEKEPERYAAIMNLLGIDPELVKMGVLRADYDSLGDWLTDRQLAGMPIPEFIGKTWTEYKVTVRTRKKMPTGPSGGSGENSGLSEESDDDRIDETPF